MFKKLLSWWRYRKLSKTHYRCSQCGHIFPKQGEKPSGWPDHPYGLHIHCPKCGHVVDQYISSQLENIP